MIEEEGFLWFIKYPLLDEAGQLDPKSFVDDRHDAPETIPGDTAVAVNPRDPRYAQLIGTRHALLPVCREQS